MLAGRAPAPGGTPEASSPRARPARPSSPRSRPPCRGAAARCPAAPGTWPHKARDWRGGRVVFPHTTPDGRVVNLYGRAVGAEAQVPKAKRHDHLPGTKGYFNAAALLAGARPLWVCEGARAA